MSLEIKFWIPGTFFPKIVWGLPIKSQELRSENKSEEKNNLEKSPKSREI